MKRKGAENIKLIKGFYQALSKNDWSAARNVLDPQIEWVEAAAEGLWFAGRHIGADAVFKDIVDSAQDKISQFQVKMKKFFVVGDTVVALGHFRGCGRATDIKLNAPTAHVWTLANGRAVRFQGFHDNLEWQVALGLTTVQSQRLAA